MSATVRLDVDGRMVEVPAGASVAAAVAQATLQFRQSSSGQARAPLCGMGVCFECRVRIDGVGQQRACLVDACDGMQVRTDG
ncbi:(2Fe-2S)-binding protein [Xanthomonas citri pv. fuscans]|uniref:(2Fe-2S)-binding protein n=1 Tax=Xanthomonas citri pv. fuscans TaxID=366649 RepID=A0AB34Q2S8_XANCI|nr:MULTISPECIES: 2Fe-2S iron-sulfur cluster-binding protein [Xanthomonas]ATB59061.1 2Fe-2S iron-sulfur cluster binding domain protein [Xanthomonas citri pv. fuscans]ATS63244.1 (2Fe-2S)-binding protein [Xanthomonas citri pv. phaseoli var. fuscans]ATS69332.1 (2Fe-2S)-binding protein [Xanthomonas citri pv. phaseoli var. fuscans]ATS71720.1 (2Fe-2S)-binding protein [Xanthomonas citri pv. phaseoli var. fuscans]ATS80712.1 (2Fe-2S)-binding protein [Xanthomonas citri pv. phaseoli var. fuscans]